MRSLCSIALGVMLCATTNLRADGPAFDTIDFPDATTTVAWGINSHGDVAGSYVLADQSQHGFLLSGGKLTPIGYPGASSTRVFGINNRGELVGDYTLDGKVHGFLRSAGRFTSFDYPGASSTSGAAINPSGDIVGDYVLADNSTHGFLLSGSHFSNLDSPGATSSIASGINANGDIVSNYTIAGVTHGQLRSGGKVTAIDVPGAAFTGAYGIDSRGNIVGRYRDAAGVTHGFVLSGGKFTTIDVPGSTFTGLTAINSAGDMVGRHNAGGVTHALLLTSPHLSYTVTDLGTLAGGEFSQGNFVADNGLIAGVADVAGGAQHSVLWQYGQMIDIGANGFGGTNNGVFGINPRGQADGIAETATRDPNGEDFCAYGTYLKCLPFLWQNGVMTPLPLLGGNNGTVGMINKRGEVVGIAETATQDRECPAPQVLDYHAVVWGPARGQIRDLPPLPGDTVGLALAINDHGQAVGASGRCADSRLPPLALGPHSVLWEADGSAVDLGNLGGTSDPASGYGNMALAINNAGQVVGASPLAGNATAHAFLWTRGAGMRDLGTLPGSVNSAALGINDRGEVIGLAFGAAGPFDGSGRPFLWRNGLMTELKSLIPADSPLSLVFAGSINSRGQIVGLAVTSDGDLHGFLATPVSGPANESASSDAGSFTAPPALSEATRSQLQQKLRFGNFPGRLVGPRSLFR